MSYLPNKKLLVFSAILGLSVLLISSSPAQASIFDDIVNGIKDRFNETKNVVTNGDKRVKSKELTIDAKIALAPNGDKKNNSEIDSGDVIRFTYVITNNTPNDLQEVTLNTNIQRNKLHFIHNVSGVTGMNYKEETITFPNLRMLSGSQATIRFDAQINYDDEDLDINTEPELIDVNKKSILKAAKREIKAKKLTNGEIQESLKKRNIINSSVNPKAISE